MVAISCLCFGEGRLASNLNLVILRIAGSIRGAVGARFYTMAHPDRSASARSTRRRIASEGRIFCSFANFETRSIVLGEISLQYDIEFHILADVSC